MIPSITTLNAQAECPNQVHYAECRYADWHYAKCHYAECRCTNRATGEGGGGRHQAAVFHSLKISVELFRKI